MLRTSLTQKELDRRAGEVFCLEDGDEIYDTYIKDDGTVVVVMTEKDTAPFDYLPDMSDRPEALDYLMGKRDDFND